VEGGKVVGRQRRALGLQRRTDVFGNLTFIEALSRASSGDLLE
jgi:hypothetical protein